MRVIKKFEMRKLKHGCGVVAQNFLLNYSLFKITLNPSKKVEFSSEKQKDMSVDGSHLKFGKTISTYNFLPQIASLGIWLKAFG